MNTEGVDPNILNNANESPIYLFITNFTDEINKKQLWQGLAQCPNIDFNMQIGKRCLMEKLWGIFTYKDSGANSFLESLFVNDRLNKASQLALLRMLSSIDHLATLARECGCFSKIYCPSAQAYFLEILLQYTTLTIKDKAVLTITNSHSRTSDLEYKLFLVLMSMGVNIFDGDNTKNDYAEYSNFYNKMLNLKQTGLKELYELPPKNNEIYFDKWFLKWFLAYCVFYKTHNNPVEDVLFKIDTYITEQQDSLFRDGKAFGSLMSFNEWLAHFMPNKNMHTKIFNVLLKQKYRSLPRQVNTDIKFCYK